VTTEPQQTIDYLGTDVIVVTATVEEVVDVAISSLDEVRRPVNAQLTTVCHAFSWLGTPRIKCSAKE